VAGTETGGWLRATAEALVAKVEAHADLG